VKISTDASLLSPSRFVARLALQAGAVFAAVGLVGFSAIIAKEARSAPLLASVSAVRTDSSPVYLTAHTPVDTRIEPELPESQPALHTAPAADLAAILEPELPAQTEVEAQPEVEEVVPAALAIDPLATDPNVRWFNGRPVRPVKVITMVVTAYSPDARSCGESADGITATLHSVETNGFKLVAADPAVLAYGSMITVPGYDSDRVVPVLDCGGAIKGRRLDVLFPTHEAARKWGVRKVPVTVWGYVDGKPAENPRRER